MILNRTDDTLNVGNLHLHPNLAPQGTITTSNLDHTFRKPEQGNHNSAGTSLQRALSNIVPGRTGFGPRTASS